MPAARRAASATCAADGRSRPRPATPLARHPAAPQPRPRHPHHPRQAGRGRRRGAATGRSCARPARRIKAARWPASTSAGAARGDGHRARRRSCTGPRDAAEANRIVTDLVRATGPTEVVKVKSMATQEIGLNEALAGGRHRRRRDRPRRADRPARPRQAVAHPGSRRSTATAPRSARSSCARWPTSTADLTDEPRRAGEAARAHLRRKFLTGRVAISGANFAVAETGTLVVVESEGNGRMCLTLPETLITVMGIEKLVPDLARPGGVPAAAAALLHRRADEPVHLDVDRRHAGRRAAEVPPRAARQRPHRGARRRGRPRRRCTASAARPA